MQRLSERATTCLRTTLSVAVALASLVPQGVVAAPPEPVPAAAEKHYDNGVRERDAGRFASAASEFAAAYVDIPTSLKELRASVLFDLVDAQRNAYVGGGRIRGNEHPAAHLCAADEALTKFIEAPENSRKGKRSTDANRAVGLRSDVRAQISLAKKETPTLDCATVEYPRDEVVAAPVEQDAAADTKRNTAPRGPRKIDKPLVIAGGVLTGFGLAMIGLMAGGLVRGRNAEADGDALVAARPTTPEDDPRLQEIDHDGKVGNRMAIAGGVISAVAIGTGVALLVVGLRGGRPSKVAVSPTMAPRALGLALRWQF